jgi:hypothetical protein
VKANNMAENWEIIPISPGTTMHQRPVFWLLDGMCAVIDRFTLVAIPSCIVDRVSFDGYDKCEAGVHNCSELGSSSPSIYRNAT